MKKAMIIALTVILGIFLSLNLQAETLPRTLIPSDANWVLHLDMDRLLSSDLFNMIMGEKGWDTIKKRNIRFAKKFRINLLEDIKGVTVYGQGRDENKAVACISGRFDQNHLLSLLSLDDNHREIAYGAHIVHSWSSGEYGAFVGENMAILSESEDSIKHALDVIAGKAKNINQSEGGGPIRQAPADVSFGHLLEMSLI